MDNDGDNQSLLTHHAAHNHRTHSTNTHGKRTACQTPNRSTCHMQSAPHKWRDQRSMPTKETPSSSQQHQQSDTANHPAMHSELTETQSKYHKDFIGLVLPHGPTLEHPAAPLLMEYMTNSCNAAIHMQWTMEMLKAAITRGAHPSALQPEPATQLRAETLEKVDQGYARLITWDSIKHNPPPTLKILPIAAIPHKSRGY